MNNDTHTPGPWSLRPESRSGLGVNDAEGNRVADGRTPADAALIAAAPDLLAELMDAVRVLDQVQSAIEDPSPTGDYVPLRAAYQRAQLATLQFNELIAKASGVSVCKGCDGKGSVEQYHDGVHVPEIICCDGCMGTGRAAIAKARVSS